MKRLLRRVLTGALLLGSAAALALPSYEEVRQNHRPSDLQVLDRDGEWLQTVRTDPNVRRGPWVALEDVSPALRTALLLSEDKRFYEHSGVDWPAVSAAAWGQLWHGRTRGASTVTMQLAGLLDGDWRQRSGGRSVVQKLGQTVAAQVLERRWRKDQILEAYLNLLPFRGELVGIDALSRTLFGKAPQGLDFDEAAIAAALVRGPNASEALVSRRACGVLAAVQAPRHADCEALSLRVAGALQRRPMEGSRGVAPHWARQVLKRLPDEARGRLSVRSTVQAPLQRFAVQTLQRHLAELSGRQVEDGALVVLDNASGEVLAWVGSSGPLSRAREVDGVLARRQVGSTLKPFLYAQALAERRLTAASLLDDSPAHIPTPGGLYIPQNYDHHFKGWVSARSALAASLNVPAVRVLALVSPDALHRQLRAAGLPVRESGDYYGYSLALGSPELALLDLSNAYRTLANGGRASELAMPCLPGAGGAPATQLPRRALDPAAAWLVGDILSDPNARARTFGTDSVLATRFWTAVKTGTSKDMRDNWAVGWSQHYTVGVWVGNASGKPMHEVSGTTGAAPVWAELMNFLHARRPSLQPPPPSGLVSQEVRFAQAPQPASSGAPGQPTWLEATRREWFLAGTEQALFEAHALSAALRSGLSPVPGGRRNSAEKAPPVLEARIVEPATGTIVALDPDIPPAHQRLNFRAAAISPAEGAEAGLRWRLDGREVARGPVWPWLPWPGRHRMQLTNAQGRVLDEIRLEVRGAGLRPNTRTPSAPR